MPALTLEIGITLGLLGVAVLLFSSNRWRVDVCALLLLALLSLTQLLPNIELIASEEVFSGFSSNAVVSLMAVMIIGAGLQRSGLMRHLLNYLLNYQHRGERHRPVLAGAAVVVDTVDRARVVLERRRVIALREGRVAEVLLHARLRRRAVLLLPVDALLLARLPFPLLVVDVVLDEGARALDKRAAAAAAARRGA